VEKDELSQRRKARQVYLVFFKSKTSACSAPLREKTVVFALAGNAGVAGIFWRGVKTVFESAFASFAPLREKKLRNVVRLFLDGEKSCGNYRIEPEGMHSKDYPAWESR
jgi:hypothetical protein